MTIADAPHPRLALLDAAAARTPAEAGSRVVRAAFCGRTSTEDRQDPTLSLPRQLRASRAALPEGVVIVAHFYDVESGRKELDQRGRGRAHERFTIAIPRDGGIQDLLAEAQRPDRRFDVVICESVTGSPGGPTSGRRSSTRWRRPACPCSPPTNRSPSPGAMPPRPSPAG